MTTIAQSTAALTTLVLLSIPPPYSYVWAGNATNKITIGASIYYVAKNGRDSRSCQKAQSAATPKKTINAGLDCLSAGATLLIQPGTYSESIGTVTKPAIPSGTSWDNPVTVKANTKGTVIIQSSREAIIEIPEPSQYIILDGLLVDGQKGGKGKRRLLRVGTRPVMNPVSHIRIQNMEFRNLRDQCVVTRQFTSDVQFIGNSVYNCRGKEVAALSWATENGLIEGNTIHDIGGDGLFCARLIAPGTPILNNIIRNNIIYNTGETSLALCPEMTGTKVYNNITAQAGLGSIRVEGDNNEIYNNTTYMSPHGVRLMPTSSNNFIKNNIIANTSSKPLFDEGSGNSKTNNLVTKNPGFVNAKRRDFHLARGSRAIDAVRDGTCPPPATDLQGIRRPQDGNGDGGGACDIGAYEFVAPRL